MPSDPDGLAIARARIAAEQEQRTGFLDLGRLGLKELPEELFALQHLWGLNCGYRWMDEQGKYHRAESDLAPNEIAHQLIDLSRLPGLTALSVSGTDLHDLAPLAALSALQSLDCSSTEVSDLAPLAALSALQSLDCSWTGVSDLAPLAALSALQSLDCSWTGVSDLAPLAALSALQSLDCSNTGVSDLAPLAALSALQSLHCFGTEVSDLAPLAALSALQSLHCSNTGVSDLAPLAALSALQSLHCFGTEVSDLAPLAALSALQSLHCSWTGVSDLAPLNALSALQSLHCSNTEVSDLAPLAALSALQSLNCSSTGVSDLAPLAALSALQSLNCSSTEVSDLAPLAALSALQSLDCSFTSVSELPGKLVWLDSLSKLVLFNTSIVHIPVEVLSPDSYTSCLEGLRAHLRDLEDGAECLPDVKALVLGNGRIGKTQICRRLRGEDFDPRVESTHGILVTSALLPLPSATEPAHLHLWDFGGQDLYHGTHALFMRTRSLFLLVWTPQSENSGEHEHNGMLFRNHPLAYWLEYVRHLSGVQSPVLIVQNMCDQPEDEMLRPPVEDEVLGAFPFRKLLHYSAREDRGCGALDDALRQAIDWLKAGQVWIGRGRLAVKSKLEALRDEDARLPVEQRKYRALTQEYFHQLCSEAGGVSNPALLLDYLHAAGIVFYHGGLFADRIVLDQAWALEAVYAVFNRERCFKQLRQLRGRFDRPLLEALVWGEYSVEEQKLFLSLMQSCGICFVHRQGDREGKLATEYIAPDLLPDRREVEAEIEATWAGHEPGGELVFALPFLHPGVMRGLISRIGQQAGISPVYWKYGVCLYEKTTRSHALIEQRPGDEPTAWSGRIALATRGGQSAELLHQLEQWVRFAIEQSGCRDWKTEETPEAPRPVHAPAAPPERKLEFALPPSKGRTYCVSYAWNDPSKKVVDDLCASAEQRGITILRDIHGVGLGESLSKFMLRLATGDRVFVILSDKYLKSPNCMFELLKVWHNCEMDLETFRARIRVYRLADAVMMTPLERMQCAIFWEDQFRPLDKLVRKRGPNLLAEADFKRYRLMQDFAHHVGDMLALIADTLLPKDFDELVKYGFNDEPSAP